MDYRTLLLKYISHVGEEEGTTFISAGRCNTCLFTDAEWAELERLQGSPESDGYDRKARCD